MGKADEAVGREAGSLGLGNVWAPGVVPSMSDGAGHETPAAGARARHPEAPRGTALRVCALLKTGHKDSRTFPPCTRGGGGGG